MLNCKDWHCDDVDEQIEKSWEYHHKKVFIIKFADTVVYPHAMMIEVADTAMFS